jgi:hypothetical protein
LGINQESSMIRIELGSIFDAKCDLLVIPCDSGGGVKDSISENQKVTTNNWLKNIQGVP